MNLIEQTVSPTKIYLGFKLVELSRRLGFVVPKVDGEVHDPNKNGLLTDMLAKGALSLRGPTTTRASYLL